MAGYKWINCPESTDIIRFGYDAEGAVLRVDFRRGGSYLYDDVDEQDFLYVVRASSKGRALNQRIKGRYSYRQI
jgi:hypothetical protein